jgi:hypothetical protein
MRLIGCIVVIFSIASGSSSSALAQSAVCNNPQSCENLHCKKTCVDVWENGVCEGGYCAQGITPPLVVQSTGQQSAAGQKDIVIHQASPALQKIIRDLLSAE